MTESMKYVLEKMCSYVNVKYEDVDFKKDNWYWDHLWTIEQEKDFCDWLENELLTNNKVRKELTNLPYRPNKKRVKLAVMMFNLAYGWKTRNK